MGRKRKKNEAQIAILTAQVKELQIKFDLFLENSSQTENPEHDKILKSYINQITKLKKHITELSK